MKITDFKWRLMKTTNTIYGLEAFLLLLLSGRLSPCMDLSMLLQDRNQLCPSSYEIVDILCPMYSLLYFILWIKWIYDLYENETCSNQHRSSWSQREVVTWE